MAKIERKHKKSSLRKQAETQLAQKSQGINKYSNQDPAVLTHELQAHQVELERQIEDLRHSQEELAESRDKYQELFNSVPVGYFVLNTQNIILDINQTAARMLATTKENLYHKRFTSFVSRSSQKTYYAEVIKVLEERRQREFDLEMTRKDRSHFLAYLYTMLIKDKWEKISQVRIAMVDVTDRRQTEEKLGFQSRMLSEVGDAIIVTDVQGKITYWNDSATRLYGWKRDEVLGRNIVEVIVPQQSQKEAAKIMRQLRRGESWTGEFLAQKKDGTVFPIDITDSLVYDPQGKVIGIIGVSRDITQRKQAEEALKESEERFRLLANTIPQLAWWANSDGYITWYNANWYRYTGTTPEQMEGWGWQSVHDPRELPKVLERWKTSISTGKPFDMVFPLRGADGRFRSFLTRVQPFKDSEGRVVQWFGTNTDVDEIKRAEEALKESEEKYRTLFSSMSEGFALSEIIVDENVNPSDYRFLEINDAFERQTGLSREKVIGKTVKEILPNIEPYWIENYGKVALTGKPIRFENYSSDLQKWYEIYAYSPKENQFAAVFVDITERKRAEAKIQEQVQMLEQAQVMVRDIRGKVIFWNQGMEIMYGYSKEQVIGEISHKLLKTVFPRPLKEIEEEVKTRGKWEGELIRTRRDGSVISISSTWTYYQVDKGSPGIIIESNYDITERKKAEEALTKAKNELEIKVKERTKELRQSEEKYRGVVDNANEVIAITQDGLIKFMNRKGMEITGYSSEEVANKHFLELIHPDDRALVADTYQRHLTGKAIASNFEFRVIPKDGRTRWAQLNATKITWEGKPAVLAVFIDITERKQVEEALKRSEEGYRNLINNANEGISIIQDGINKLVNKKGLKISGYSMKEMTNKSFLELAHPNDRKAIMESYQRFLAGEAVRLNYEFRILRKDGSIRWIQINVADTLWEGRAAILTMFSDITERKQAEDKINKLLGLRALLIEISSRFVNVPVERLDDEIRNAQRRLCEYLDLDLSSIYLPLPEDQTMMKLAYLFAPPDFPAVADAFKARDYYPWCEQQLVSGKSIAVPSTKNLPPEAAVDQASWQHFGIKSSLMFPLVAGDKIIGTLSFDSIREECPWPEELISGLKQVAQVFANAIARKQSEEALKTYAQRITQVQEEERKRIAYELHDNTAQYLSILKMQLGALSQSKSIQDPNIREKLQYLEKDADMAFNDVRRYSHDLRPVILERSGLIAALEQLVEDYNKLGQLQIKMKIGREEPKLPEEVKLGFFRIAQEALNNIRKHAKATQINIILTFREDQLEMSVSDNGIGFDIMEASARASGKGSLGLMSMKERADLIKANLKIESKPGYGTTIRVEIPL
jgi:PAS domain S-box-containing protein